MCYKCWSIQLSAKLEGLEPELKRIAQLIHDGKLKTGQIDKAMVAKIAEQLMSGVFTGYGKNLDDKLSETERTFLNQIQRNVYVFSGFKNYQQLKETSLLLKDDDGKLKSFNDFLNDVKQVNSTYNEVYLNAEYSNAVASAQMAQTWHDYETNGIETLTYRTAGDDRVRDDHAILDGTTLPIDDPFWSTYYPPNDWGCRCDVEPGVDNSKVKPSANELPDIPPMFQNNVGQSGILFPDTHPYFEVSKGIAKEIEQQVEDIIPQETVSEFVPKGLTKYQKALDIEIDSEVFSYLKRQTPMTSVGKSAHYTPSTNIVNIPVDDRRRNSKWKSESVVYHEYAHAADFQNEYGKLSDVKNLMSHYKAIYKDELGTLTNKIYTELRVAIDKGDHDTKEKLGAVADTIMSLNKNYGFGHNYKVTYGKKRVDYFDLPGYKESEFLAHSFENKFAGNEVFKRLMPDLYEDMIDLVNDLPKPK